MFRLKLAGSGRIGLCLGALVCASLAFGQGPVVGKFSAVRNAKVTKGAYATSKDFVDAKAGQAVREGQGVRTFRRSFAEITFSDSSVIRINEQTDMVIQSVSTLRKVRLEKGAVWIRDEKGSRTSVQTPVATATARGTEFSVTEAGSVSVKEGEVDLEAKGTVITVGPGEIGFLNGDGVPTKLPFDDPGVPEQARDKPNTPDYGGGEPFPSILSLAAISFTTNYFGNGGGDRTSTPVVPEPGTIAALALGAGFLAARRRRR